MFRRCSARLQRTTVPAPNSHKCLRSMAGFSAHTEPGIAPIGGPVIKNEDDLFRYSRMRFLCREAYEMSQRHVVFNVHELSKIAAQAVGAKSCASIEKCPDGMFNKAMLLTMDDGTEVVAKIPNPNAGLPHFSTASEVATMDFALNVLETPVPEVLAWSSTADNPVGTEYIIMEKVVGVELEQAWPKMPYQDRVKILRELARFQISWQSVSFRKYGSLYFAKDLKDGPGDGVLYTDSNGVNVTNTKYAVGPTTRRGDFDDGRSAFEFDRGPWDTLEQYHTAIGHREITSVKQVETLPKSPLTVFGPGTYQPTREKKLKALDCYLSMIKYLLPQDRTLGSSHLWHGDLHDHNIFVNPSKPTEIVGLIDWQSTHLSPLYAQGLRPGIVDYEGPSVSISEPPQLPDDYDTFDAVDKSWADKAYLDQSFQHYYKKLISIHVPQLHAAVEFQETMQYMMLSLSGKILVDGEAMYLGQVVELKDEWDTFSGFDGSQYPFDFTDDEIKEIGDDVNGTLRGMHIMRQVRDAVREHYPEQGIIEAEKYDEAIKVMNEIKEQVIDQVAKREEDKEIWRRAWPFDP